MIEGSKDPEINKIRFRASKNVFQNSTCVFVEYTDVLQLQWFTFLSFFRENKKLDDIFRTDEIRYLSVSALLNEYFNRPYRNPLAGLVRDNRIIDFEQLDELLDSQVNSNEIFFNQNVDTNVVFMVGNLLANKLIQRLVIYYPTENEFVKKDIESKFGDKAELVTGDLKQILLSLPQDTTYFFSDVNHVLLLEETKKINYSAIMLAADYRYNFLDDEKTKFIIDMDYLSKNYIFKWATFHLA